MNSIEKFDNSKKYPRHEKCHTSGGVWLKDEEGATVNTRDVMLSLLKSVGSKLKEGKVLDLLKISRPAIISFPRTYLECLANDLKYTKFLDMAAQIQDPTQRMKHIIAFFISGFHCNIVEMGNNGPLNPILGETYYATKRDGTKLFCEQISHHPPVSAYLMTGAEDSYRLYGTGEVAAKMVGMNTINGHKIGDTIIQFKNGDKITIGSPDMRIDGVFIGTRTINYIQSFSLVDHTHKITAEVTFNYDETGTISKVASGLKSFFTGGSNSAPKPLYDTFTVRLFSSNEQKDTNEVVKTEICKGSGSWLSHLEIDGELYWKLEDQVEDTWTEDLTTKLVSDSTYRQDAKCIKERNFDQAQKEKDALENLQRYDAKLRKGTDASQH